jgi:hypothetical protein
MQAAVLACGLRAMPVAPEEEGEGRGEGRPVTGGPSAADMRGEEAEEGNNSQPAANGRSTRGQAGKGSGGLRVTLLVMECRTLEWSGGEKRGACRLGREEEWNRGGASCSLAVQREGKGRVGGWRPAADGRREGWACGGACEASEKPKGSRP